MSFLITGDNFQPPKVFRNLHSSLVFSFQTEVERWHSERNEGTALKHREALYLGYLYFLKAYYTILFCGLVTALLVDWYKLQKIP